MPPPRITGLVKEILARELNLEISSLSPELRLREDLGMDSIIALNLIFSAERELNVTLKEDDVVGLTTVSDLEALVARLTKSPLL